MKTPSHSPRRRGFLASLPALVLTVCLGVVPGIVPGISHASAASDLESYFDGLKTLSASFTQLVYAKDGEAPQQSSGIIEVERPNRFRLEYTKPYHQIYVADGKRLWSYDADLEQVTVKPQGQLLANTPAMLLSNPKRLNESFTVADLGERKGKQWFELTPRTRDTNFQRVALGFNGPRQLAVMVLQDSLGQTTRLEFHDSHYNTPIAASRFRFVPPKGVDVIGE